MPRVNTVALAALAAPAALTTLAAAIFVAAELLGVTPPLAESAPRNLAEAAGLGSLPDVWRYLDEGQDPTALYDVRPHIISSSVRKVTTGEAAIWSRRVELVEFLERRGALGDSAARRHLACLAAELKTGDIVEYLAGEAPPPECPSSTIELITARTR